MARCDYTRRARTEAEREAGCPLDHCPSGGHHIDRERYWRDGLCPECESEGPSVDLDAEIAAVERSAGWDPGP